MRKMNETPIIKKRKDIIELYKEGGLSISDTIAYENNLLIERNRRNTSTIVTIIAINIVVVILGALLVAGGL
tara:strand:+ start:524 stop:739 length:216 start_codon:yes stop_codon:yes gene_type:complete